MGLVIEPSEAHPDFAVWQKYFIDNDFMLWPDRGYVDARRVASRANKLAAPIAAENQRSNCIFELSAFADMPTGNVILKAYRCDGLDDERLEVGFGMVVSRAAINCNTDADLDIKIAGFFRDLADHTMSQVSGQMFSNKIQDWQMIKTG